MSTPPYLRLVPLEEEEEPVEVELEISPRDLAVMAASVCACLLYTSRPSMGRRESFAGLSPAGPIQAELSPLFIDGPRRE